MIALDHIVLAARTLPRGVAVVRDLTGVTVPPGGVHPKMGTHNALTATGGGSYLEIIAPDPDQGRPVRPRAFAIDKTNLTTPRLQTFLVRSDDIDRDLAIAREAGFDLGAALAMSRGDLHWKIALHEDRKLTAGGAFPGLLQWPDGPHVSAAMDDQGLDLHQLNVASPQADLINETLVQMGFSDPRVVFKTAQETLLTATYRTPDGRLVTLG